MTTVEIQRRLEALKKKRETMQKYENLWKGRITLKELLRKAGEKYPETPDWCALCMKEIDVPFETHLLEYHKVTMKQVLLGGDYKIENNDLLLMMINDVLEHKQRLVWG
jgi:hypothetical protein